MVLSDGASTTILPPGWTHLRQSYDVPQSPGQQVRVDIFGPGRLTAADTQNPRARLIAFGFLQLPNGQRADLLFSPRVVQAINARNADISRTTGRATLQAGRGRFGNVSGITLNIPVPNLGTVPLLFGGRGSKMYILYNAARGTRGTRQIVDGFRGR